MCTCILALVDAVRLVDRVHAARAVAVGEPHVRWAGDRVDVEHVHEERRRRAVGAQRRRERLRERHHDLEDRRAGERAVRVLAVQGRDRPVVDVVAVMGDVG